MTVYVQLQLIGTVLSIFFLEWGSDPLKTVVYTALKLGVRGPSPHGSSRGQDGDQEMCTRGDTLL